MAEPITTTRTRRHPSLPVASERAGAGSLDPDTTSVEQRDDLATGSTSVAAGGDVTGTGEGPEASPPVVHLTAPVLGLDLSLASTGVAGPDWSCLLKPHARTRGLDRMRWIAKAVADIAQVEKAMLVVVEGPAYHQGADAGAHERAGLWWHVAHTLDQHGYPIAVVGPSQLKRYATGKGNAGKDLVLTACVRRFAWFDGGNDQADATWLAAMGADWLGKPMTTVPAAQREALDKVTWPEGLSRD